MKFSFLDSAMCLAKAEEPAAVLTLVDAIKVEECSFEVDGHFKGNQKHLKHNERHQANTSFNSSRVFLSSSLGVNALETSVENLSSKHMTLLHVKVS